MPPDPGLEAAIAALVELIAAGEPAPARARANALLERHPQQAELWRLRGICALQLGDTDEALLSLTQAADLAPRSVEILCNIASVHSARGKFADAEAALRRALELDPAHAAALNNLGTLLDARGEPDAAAECFARAVALQPGYARAWLNQAGVLLTLCRLDPAEASARRALQLAPQWGDAFFVLGNVLAAAGRAAEAEACYRDAARWAPRDARFHYQLALALDGRGEYAQTLLAYRRALDAQADFAPALSQLVFLKRRLCDWHELQPLSKRLIAAVDRGAEGVTPFSFLAEEGTPAQQLACAERFAALKQAQVASLQPRLAFAPAPRGDGVLRLGFVSSGFVEHPTALLIVELIERLRDAPLRTIAFATTADDGGPLRARLVRGFGEFHDLSRQPLQAMLQSIRAAHVDVLVDLDGYCEHSRPELFALRAAPLQVNWLAYPGSLGAPWYDYLIADRFLIPREERVHYAEAVALLPRCYQPTDTTRAVPVAAARAQYGLPERAFVFASFNNSWKFTLRSFARWMKILAAVPGSVLWLLTGPARSGADERLRRAAAAAGIDPARLVFAARAGHPEHLARHRHADLFLDTNPYNAHTTASDAIWAGCPVLTQPGATFASRVAGSLNHHLGLAELNAASDAAYVELAVRLAHDPAALGDVRTRLEQARAASSLFDMAGYARDFAALVDAMFKRHEAGYDVIDIEDAAS